MRWKRLGYLSLDTNERTNFQARELKTVYVNSLGSFLKLIINSPHLNNKNLYSQVGLVNITVFGTLQMQMLENVDILPSISSFGVNVASKENQDSFLLSKMKELNTAKVNAVDVENYDLANEIKAHMEYLKSGMEEISLVEQKKTAAVVKEDYETAALLKGEIAVLRQKILDGIPSHFGKGSQSTQFSTNGVRKSRITPRDNIPEMKPTITTNPNDERPIRPVKSQQPPSSPPIPALRGGLKLREIETEIVHPKTSEVGEAPPVSDKRQKETNSGELVVSKATEDSGTPIPAAKLKEVQPLIDVFGEESIVALFEKKWQLRESAVKNIQKNLPNFADGDPSIILSMGCKVVELAFEDKLLQVCTAGISLLESIVEYSTEVSRHTVHGVLQTVLGVVVDRTGDSNARAREAAMKCLVLLASQPHVGVSFVASFVMKRKVQGWRPILGKLEFLVKMIPEHNFGDSEKRLPRDSVLSFINSNFDNPNAEVRNMAVTAMVEAFRLDSRAVRLAVANVKPQIKDILDAKFKDIGETPQKAKPKKKKQSSSKAAPSPMKKQTASRVVSSPVKKTKKKEVPQEMSAELSDLNPEDSFEVFTTDGTTCQFCGVENEAFKKGGVLDLHLMRQCPMLIECNCGQVIELSCLSEHFLMECDGRSEYQQCKKCKEAVHLSDIGNHKGCHPLDDVAFIRCPLCKKDVHREEEETQWRQHAIYECTENPRGMH